MRTHPHVAAGQVAQGWGTVQNGLHVPGLAGRGEGLRRSHDEAAGAKPGAWPVDRNAVNVGTVAHLLPAVVGG